MTLLCPFPVLREWMYIGLFAGRSRSNDPKAEGQIWRWSGGDFVAFKVNGILLERSPFLCGKGCHDWLREIEDSRARWELQPSRRDLAPGKPWWMSSWMLLLKFLPSQGCSGMSQEFAITPLYYRQLDHLMSIFIQGHGRGCGEWPLPFLCVHHFGNYGMLCIW